MALSVREIQLKAAETAVEYHSSHHIHKDDKIPTAKAASLIANNLSDMLAQILSPGSGGSVNSKGDVEIKGQHLKSAAWREAKSVNLENLKANIDAVLEYGTEVLELDPEGLNRIHMLAKQIDNIENKKISTARQSLTRDVSKYTEALKHDPNKEGLETRIAMRTNLMADLHKSVSPEKERECIEGPLHPKPEVEPRRVTKNESKVYNNPYSTSSLGEFIKTLDQETVERVKNKDFDFYLKPRIPLGQTVFPANGLFQVPTRNG